MKERFQLPPIQQERIDDEIAQIIAKSDFKRGSFFTYMKRLYKHLGFRSLFSDQTEVAYFILTVSVFVFYIFMNPGLIAANESGLYVFFAIVSPLLFIVLSLYMFAYKKNEQTYEVEFVCKYNLWQVIAFRMFGFSLLSIGFNGLMIVFISVQTGSIELLRALMISTTSILLFSLLFLYMLMRYSSYVSLLVVSVSWGVGHFIVRMIDQTFYTDMLFQLPLYVYAIMIMVAVFFYVKKLTKLCEASIVERGI